MMAPVVSGTLKTHPSTHVFICPTPKMLLQVCGLGPPPGVCSYLSHLMIECALFHMMIIMEDSSCLHSLWIAAAELMRLQILLLCVLF